MKWSSRSPKKCLNPRAQPAVREYLTKLRQSAFLEIKTGFVDTGAAAGRDTAWVDTAQLHPETVSKAEVATKTRKKHLLWTPGSRHGGCQHGRGHIQFQFVPIANEITLHQRTSERIRLPPLSSLFCPGTSARRSQASPTCPWCWRDRSGEIDAKMWDNVAEVMDSFDRDDFVRVKGLMQIFQNRPQFTIHKLIRVSGMTR